MSLHRRISDFTSSDGVFRRNSFGRMTTEPIYALVDEKQNTQKDASEMPNRRSKQKADVAPAIPTPETAGSSGLSGEGMEKDRVIPDVSPPKPAQPVVQTHMSTRSSTRTIKRPRRDTLSPPASPVKKPVKETKSLTPETKRKRQWELWSVEDKNTFFDGLYEFGKDFEAIQGLIAHRCKKKGVAQGLIKNKDQVRHFYYRTWHKISKYTEFPEGVKKQTQELYALINYGELRKKIGGLFLTEKDGLKLKDLIHKGQTVVKMKGMKGKNQRVRTPICNALKKLNNVEDPKVEEGPKVPEKLIVEIGARTNAAWSRVQELAQNPRIRMTLKPSHSLSTVVAFLEKKWKPQRLRIKESLGSPEVPSKELRLFPHKDSEIQTVSVKVAAALPRPDLTFDNYKENVLENKVEGFGIGSDNSHPGVDKVNSPEGLLNACARATCTVSMQSPGFFIDDENAMFPDDLTSCCGPPQLSPPSTSPVKSESNLFMTSDMLNRTADLTPAETAPTNLFDSGRTLNVHCDNAVEMSPMVASTSGESAAAASARNAEDNEQDCLVQRIRKGWSCSDCENLTLAELYLMFGQDGKLRLEYDLCDIRASEMLLLQRLTNLLRRLVHLATTEFTDFSKSKPTTAVSSAPQNLCQKCSGAIGGGKSGAGRNSSRNSAAKNSSSPGGTKNSAKPKREPSPESQEAVFRVPAAMLTRNISQQRILTGSRLDAARADMLQRGQADLLMRGPVVGKRPHPALRKPMIVQRRLLPKAQVQAHQLMSMAMVPTPNVAGGTAQFLPMAQSPAQQQQIRLSSPSSSPPVMGKAPLLPRPVTNRNLPIRPSTVPVSSPIIMNPGPSLPTSYSLPHVNVPLVASGVHPSDSEIMNQIEADLAAILPSHSPLRGVHPSDSEIMNQIEADLAAILPSHSPLRASSTTSAPSITSVLHVNTTLPSGTMHLSTSPDVGVSGGLGTVITGSISPPSISSFLDISLSQPPTGLGNTDKLLELALGQSGNSNLGLPEGVVDGQMGQFALDPGLRTPMYPSHEDQAITTSNGLLCSPFKLDLGADSQWIGGETSDLSLSGFLVDSPAKKSGDIPTTSSMSVPPLNLFSDASRESTITRMDVDSTLQCMLSENSMDYVAKFADIAAQMSASAEHGHKGKSDSTSQESAAVQ